MNLGSTLFQSLAKLQREKVQIEKDLNYHRQKRNGFNNVQRLKDRLFAIRSQIKAYRKARKELENQTS